MPLKRQPSGKGLTRLLCGGGLFFLLSLPVTSLADRPANPIHDPAGAGDLSAATATHNPVFSGPLTVADSVFPARALTLMHALVQRDDPGISRDDFLDAVIESHLVADHVRAENARALVLDSEGVGFSPRVQTENRQVATLRALFAEPLGRAVQGLGENGLNALLLAPLEPDMARIAAVLGTGPRHIYTLTDAEQLAADSLVLTRFRFPGDNSVRRVTLGELYRRQNVQGRLALHAADRIWLVRETQLYIGQQFVRWWLTQHSGESASTLAAIDTLVEDRLLRQGWLAHTGVAAEIHAGNPALKAAAEQVTRAEIHQWYQQHQSRFREVRAARARVARCDDKRPCDQLPETTADSDTPWHRQAPDTVHITQGWYRRGESQDWLTDVVLMQPGETLSRTIRAPHDAGWYRIQVLERQWHTHAVDSLTVDMVARREIARQRLVQDYLALTERLRQQARIERPAS